LFGKLSSDSFQEAFDSRRYVLLDPWYNASWSYRKPITINEGNATDRMNEPVILNVTGLTGVANCSDVRVTGAFTTETALSWQVLDNSGSAYAAGKQYCLLHAKINLTTTANATYLARNTSNVYVYYGNTTNTGSGEVADLGAWESDNVMWQAPVNDGWTVQTNTGGSNATFAQNGHGVWEVNETTGLRMFWHYGAGVGGVSIPVAGFTMVGYAKSISGGYFTLLGVETHDQRGACFNINNAGWNIEDYNSNIFNSGTTTTTDAFHEYRIVSQGATAVVYKDGVLLTAISNITALIAASNQLHLGDFFSSAHKVNVKYLAWEQGEYPPLSYTLGAEETPLTPVSATQTYNATVYETTTNYLTLNVTFNASLFNNATASIDWNGVNYSVTDKTVGSDNINFTFTSIQPLIAVNNTVNNFTWYYNATYYNATPYSNSTPAATQNVWIATYFANVSVSPNPSNTFTLVTITSNVTNLGSAAYTLLHYYNGTSTAPYSLGGLWLSTNNSDVKGNATVNATLNVTFNGASLLRTSSNVIVNVTEITLAVCTAGGTPVINFSTFDEDDSGIENASHFISFTIWNTGRTNSATYNFTVPNVAYLAICASVNASFNVDSFQTYNGTTGYYQRSYFLYNAPVNGSVTQNVSLYLQATTVSKHTRITVKDVYGVVQSGVYVSALRYFPGNATSLLVAMIYTDSNGQGNTYLQPNDVYYSFVENKASVLTYFTSRQIICDSASSICDLTIQAEAGSENDYLKSIGSIYALCTDNNATNYTSCTFADASGYYHHYTMLAVKQGITVNTIVCNTTMYTSTGTISCLLNQTGQYAISLYAGGSPIGELTGLNVIRGVTTSIFQQAGLSSASGAFLAIPIVLTILLGAMTTPATGLIFGAFSLVFLAVIGLFYMSAATIALLIIFAVLIAWKLKI